MANIKISALTSLSSVVDSTIIPVVNSGTNYKITASQIKTYMGLGNVSLINKDGNASNILYGNGVFASAPSAGTTYGNSNVATFLASFGSNTLTTTGNVTAGNIIISGATTTGINSVLAGPTFTPLANTMGGFVSNVNNYTQLTIQNKSTGADATTDFIATADNGSDTVNYLDMGIINSGYDNLTPTNSLGNIVYAADSYIYAQGNTSATGQSGGNLAIGTTVAGKTVKIFAGGVTASNIVATIANTGVSVTGNVTATKFVGDGSSLTNVTVNAAGNIQGTSSNVSLVAGSYSYTFDNTAILTLPAPATGNEGGEIDFTKAANSSLSGTTVVFDQYVDRFRFFEGGGTNRGVYIDFTQAAAGVGTLLNNRVSGFVNSGTFVTMDNIKATVTTSGQRGLSLATTAGTISYNIGGTFGMSGAGSGGSLASQTLTTSATTSIFSWSFGGEGDVATYILTDKTNSRCYRITVQIGYSYNNNMISIERLI